MLFCDILRCSFLFKTIQARRKTMSVYLEATRDGQPLLPTIIFSAREFGLLQRVLGTLADSHNDPHRAYIDGWNIARVEDEPRGYLPWYMSSHNVEEDQEAPPFGSHEALIVYEHVLSIVELSDERIVAIVSQAYGDKLQREIPFNETTVLEWFKARLTDLLLVLKTISETQNGKLNFI
jgi:hypothetical protein